MLGENKMKITIGNKLKLAFTIIIAAMLIVTGISYVYLQNSNHALQGIDYETERVDLYNDIAFQTVRANAAIRGYMIYKDEEMLNNHKEIRQTLRDSVTKLSETGEKSEDFSTFVKQLDEWESNIDTKILTNLTAGNLQEAEKNAKPILGKGSQSLVVFSKQMANDHTKAIHKKIETLESDADRQLITIIIIATIIILVSILIATITGRNIGRRMQRTIDTLNVFSTGDLTQRLEMGSKDEFAQLAQSFNSMADRLGHMMQTVNQSSQTVAAASAELTASSEEVSNAAINAADSIQGISSSLENQEQRTHQMREVTTGLLTTMHDISTIVDATTDAMHEAKQMADEGSNAVTDVTQQMDIIATHTLALNERMSDLDDNTSSIELAVNVIKDIADQTNLLALNASIEAARAGDAGKGFAVVAEEVRKLADESNKAAGEIEEVVSKIMSNTKSIEQDITDSHFSVTIGKHKVDTASELFAKIVNGFDIVHEQANSVNERIHHIHDDIAVIVDQTTAIDASAERSLTRAQNIASAAEEQTASIQEIAAATANLAEQANELADTIKNFNY